MTTTLKLADTSMTAQTVTLTTSPATNDIFYIKDSAGNASTNHVTIDGVGKNIDGEAKRIITHNWGAYILIYGCIEWHVLARDQHAWFNVRDHGLKGDGSTDDSEKAIDLLVALKAAPPPRGVTLYFPDGHYIFDGKPTSGLSSTNGSATFNLKGLERVTVLGESKEGTILEQTGDADGGGWSLFDLRGNARSVTFRNIQLRGGERRGYFQWLQPGDDDYWSEDDPNSALVATVREPQITDGSGATAASITFQSGVFALINDAQNLFRPLDLEKNITITGGLDQGTVFSSVDGTYSLSDGQTLTVKVNGVAADTVTFNTADFSDIAAATASEVVAVINTDVSGATAVVWGAKFYVESDTTGATSRIQVTGGTARTILGLDTTAHAENNGTFVVSRADYYDGGALNHGQLELRQASGLAFSSEGGSFPVGGSLTWTIADPRWRELHWSGSRVGAQTFPADVGRYVPNDVLRLGIPSEIRAATSDWNIKVQPLVNTTAAPAPSLSTSGRFGLALISDDDAEYAALEYDGTTFQIWGKDSGGLFTNDAATSAVGNAVSYRVAHDRKATTVKFFYRTTLSGSETMIATETSVSFSTDKTFKPILYWRSTDTNATPDEFIVKEFSWLDASVYDKDAAEQHHLVEFGVGGDGTEEQTWVDFQNVRFQETIGDGIRLLGSSAHTWKRLRILDCDFIECGRGGVSVQHDVEEVIISRNYFYGGTDQLIDFEPSSANGPQLFLVEDNILDARRGSNAAALSLSGVGINTRHERSRIAGNRILGSGINALDIGDVAFEGNLIEGGFRSSAHTVDFTGAFRRLTLNGNKVWQRSATHNVLPFRGAIRNDRFADTCLVNDNLFVQEKDSLSCLKFDDGCRLVSLCNNIFHYEGYPTTSDFHVTISNTAGNEMSLILFNGNQVWGSTGAAFRTIATAKNVVVTNNIGAGPVNIGKFENGDLGTPPIVTGNSIEVSGDTDVFAGIQNTMGVVIAGNVGGRARNISYGDADPESFALGSPGCLYLRSTGELYLKESGNQTETGWAQVGKRTVASKTANYTTAEADDLILATISSGTITLVANPTDGTEQTIKNLDATSLTVAATSGDTVNGATSLAQDVAITYVFDKTNRMWEQIANG